MRAAYLGSFNLAVFGAFGVVACGNSEKATAPSTKQETTHASTPDQAFNTSWVSGINRSI